MSDNSLERRDFIKKAGAVFSFGLFASSFGAVMNSCEKDEVVDPPEPETVEIDLNPYPVLANPGGFSMVKVTKKDGSKVDVIINRIDSTTFTVLDNICRHMGCTVTLPSSSANDIICLCHNVQFNLKSGEVTVKPIPDAVPNLTKYKVFEYVAASNVLKVIL